MMFVIVIIIIVIVTIIIIIVIIDVRQMPLDTISRNSNYILENLKRSVSQLLKTLQNTDDILDFVTPLGERWFPQTKMCFNEYPNKVVYMANTYCTSQKYAHD